jgi:hypothetical protein
LAPGSHPSSQGEDHKVQVKVQNRIQSEIHNLFSVKSCVDSHKSISLSPEMPRESKV